MVMQDKSVSDNCQVLRYELNVKNQPEKCFEFIMILISFSRRLVGLLKSCIRDFYRKFNLI